MLSAPAYSDDSREIILNEDCYWRTANLYGNEKVSPELVKRGPSKWVSQDLLEKTKRGILKNARHRLSKHQYKNFEPEKWHDHVYIETTSKSQYSHNHGLTHEKRPSPGNWMQPDFDDLDWPRNRNPHLMGTPPLISGYYTGVSQLDVGRACFRAFFEVTDPDKGALTLSLAYRGGVRVFLNGTEIARGHLPKGRLDLKTTAEGYPPEAYVMLEGEGEPYRAFYRKTKDDILFWADLYGPFKMPGKPRRYYQQVHPNSQAVWKRIQRLRDRKIEGLELPRKLLERGSNCLAVEVVRSDLHPVALNRSPFPWGRSVRGSEGNVAWSHGCLPRVELRAPKGTAVSSLKRPAGVRIWAEDIHAERYPFDFLGRGAPAGKLHALGPRNGAAGALFVVGADKDIEQVRIDLSDCMHKDPGRRSKAPQLTIYSLKQRFIQKYAANRSFNSSRGFVLHKRYPKGLAFLKRFGFQRGYEVYIRNKLSYLDQLHPGVIGDIKKDTIQPYWISVQIPKDAAAGQYTGTVTVRARGVAPKVLPLTIEVMDWTLPDPNQFQTVVGLEQSPYGVAKQYNVTLWSDEHFGLIEASMKQLARVGNDWLIVPCIRKTQFGNRDDQMIRWTRKRDGTLAFDFSIMDRYVDLAQKHWGTLSVISLVVAAGNQLDVGFNVMDEASGKVQVLQVCDPKGGLIEARKGDLAAFAKAVHKHMKARNLLQSTYWGFTWDNTGNPAGLKEFLAETAPGIFWCRGGHQYRFDKYYKVSTSQYGWSCDVDALKFGWKSDRFALLSGSCRVNPISDNNPPHVYRT
ncbi:hypothetical protein LCGC14_1523200, partial [marine sediment metagenome]